jgi:glycosyltransferase involved in cell wall biosynthesis
VSAVIVGDGQMRTSLEMMTRELGIADNVRFVGHQANVETWLQDSKVFVLTSDSEGLSLALIEAMLCGVPAVVSHVGDLGDLVDEGVNGHLIRERLALVFAARVLELLQDNERRQRFSRAARSAAVRFDIEVCAQAWDRVLNASQDQIHDASTRLGPWQ